jgi:Flavoprotein
VTSAPARPLASAPVLYVIACATPPVLHIQTGITLAQQHGWAACLVLTPTAARWLSSQTTDLEELTGYPVRSAYKLPGEADVLPSPDAMFVAPASSNTINKWALGISDTLALGLITEGIGKKVPIVAMPYLSQAQAAHPAFPHNVDVLQDSGVNILIGPTGWQPHAAGGSKPEQFPWHLGLEALAKCS